MIMIGEIYNFWTMALMYVFQGMMHDKRYRYWLRYFQIPMNRSPDDVKLVGYSKAKLIKFWQLSSKLQSFILKSTLVESIFVMTLSATSYLILMHQRYEGKLHSPAVFWTILIVSYTCLRPALVQLI